MIKIALINHEYKYEAFQIASLFYEKSEFSFEEEEKSDFLSIYNEEENKCIFKSKDGKIHIEENILNNKKDIKIGLKVSMLNGLKKLTNKDIPWGILIGIRPTKLYHELKLKDLSDNEIKDMLVNKYYLHEEKANLLIEVAKNEIPFLSYKNNSISLYIGIPFCPTRCIYCSFTSNAIGKNTDLVEDYLNALILEIEYTFKLIREKNINIDTLYIGGGTPTSLNEVQLEKLLSVIDKSTNINNVREYTIEAGRPDSINKEKLEIMKKYKATRISINPQTMSNETLKNIGRSHSKEDIKDVFNIARNLGFNNINMDIIIGLPGENKENVRDTMEELVQLNPDSITVHTMAIKRASKLYENGYNIKNEEAISMFNIADKAIRETGMKPYYMYRQKNMVSPLENIGYSYNGKESIYNIQMIGEIISIVGLGADSISKPYFKEENRIERIPNLKDVREYINRIDEILARKERCLNLL